jgi:hypothetical protein
MCEEIPSNKDWLFKPLLTLATLGKQRKRSISTKLQATNIVDEVAQYQQHSKK